MIDKPENRIKKCAICGSPTYHYVCASCKSQADADEAARKEEWKRTV